MNIEYYLIGIEPHLVVMMTRALESEAEIRQSMIADNLGENGDPTKTSGRVRRCSSKLYCHISRKENAGQPCRTDVGTDWKRCEDCTSVLAR